MKGAAAFFSRDAATAARALRDGLPRSGLEALDRPSNDSMDDLARGLDRLDEAGVLSDEERGRV